MHFKSDFLHKKSIHIEADAECTPVRSDRADELNKFLFELAM